MTLSDAAAQTAGILLLSVVAVEWGGAFLFRVATGRVGATDVQRRLYRAGHAHAGVLVTLGLVTALLADATSLTGVPAQVARSGVALAAILMSAGFFAAAAGRTRAHPAGVALLIAGAASLAAGVLTLGLALLLSR
jgi:hypothetical protein